MDLDFWKGGHNWIGYHYWCGGSWDMHCHSVQSGYKHANPRADWGHAPRKWRSLGLNLRAFLVIYHPWTQIYKMSQKGCHYLHAYSYPSSYSAIVYLNICAITCYSYLCHQLANTLNTGWQCSRYTCELIKCIVLKYNSLQFSCFEAIAS